MTYFITRMLIRKMEAIIAVVLLILLTGVPAITEQKNEQGSALQLSWGGVLPISLRIPSGGSEGALFVLENKKGFVVKVEYEPGRESKMQLYLVKEVRLDEFGAVPDVLIAISSGAVIRVKQNQLFYLRASSSSMVNEVRAKVVFEGQGNQASLEVHISPVPVSLASEIPVTLQASIWPYQDWKGKEKEARIKNLLRILTEYHLNGAAGVSGGIRTIDIEENTQDKSYYELARFCLDDLHFKRLRIPAKKMYNFKNPLSKESFSGSKEAFIEEQLATYFSQIIPVIRNLRWAGKLGFKIWDEPRPGDYPDVVLSYKIAKKLAPSLKLELSEQPDPRLQDVADVWTPYIKFLKPEDVEEQHRKGKEVWMYANKVHGIDHPAYGMRILGWLIWKYKLDGYLFWAVNWWKEDPWTTVSSQKKDFLKRGTLVYPGPDGRIYPSLRLEEFREGIEDMLLLRELEKVSTGNGSKAHNARALVSKLKKVYDLSERYDNAPDPAQFRDEILDALVNNE